MFIEFVLDTISLFVFLGLLIWGFIFGMKIYVKKKKNKELINFSRKVELTFNKFIKSLWRICQRCSETFTQKENFSPDPKYCRSCYFDTGVRKIKEIEK